MLLSNKHSSDELILKLEESGYSRMEMLWIFYTNHRY